LFHRQQLAPRDLLAVGGEAMPRTKKPDAPKFEPVFIADYRPEVRSLATPEAERAKMQSEDFSRIVAERALAELKRLEVLKQHLGFEGLLGDNLLVLLTAVARKYVPGFAVEVGKTLKPGRKKIGDRFKTVTEVERRQFERNLPSISAAIESVAAERRPAIRPQELSTKYFACRREIEANPQSLFMLGLWRQAMPTLQQGDLPDFEFMFWEIERTCFGATTPHNVERLRPRKS
jgi:hypothetical protein